MTKCKICHRKVDKLRLGMCAKHYGQYKKYGYCLDKNPRTLKDRNEIVICSDYAEIILYDKQNNETARTKIDLEDVNKVKHLKWCIDKHGYAVCGNLNIKLHRHVMNCPIDMVVDHINRKPLDNRKSNLRICTKQQNEMNTNLRHHNTSGVTGVGFHKESDKWRAYIQNNGEFVHLGLFDKKEEAIESRKNAEIKYFGEYRNKY